MNAWDAGEVRNQLPGILVPTVRCKRTTGEPRWRMSLSGHCAGQQTRRLR